MTISDYDAWVLCRPLVGHALSVEVHGVSRPFRGVAERLASRSPEGRQEARSGFLSGCDDADIVIVVLANIDPPGPYPPARSGPEAGGPASRRR